MEIAMIEKPLDLQGLLQEEPRAWIAFSIIALWNLQCEAPNRRNRLCVNSGHFRTASSESLSRRGGLTSNEPISAVVGFKILEKTENKVC